jgi:hypothetical protein
MGDFLDLLVKIGEKLQSWFGDILRCIKTTTFYYEEVCGKINEFIRSETKSLTGGTDPDETQEQLQQEQLQDKAFEFRGTVVEIKKQFDGWKQSKEFKIKFCG